MSSDTKSTKSGAFKDKEKPHDVRVSNITAAKGKELYVNSLVMSLTAELVVEVFVASTFMQPLLMLSGRVLGLEGWIKWLGLCFYVSYCMPFLLYGPLFYVDWPLHGQRSADVESILFTTVHKLQLKCSA